MSSDECIDYQQLREGNKLVDQHGGGGIPTRIVKELAERVSFFTMDDIAEWVVEYFEPESFKTCLNDRFQKEKAFIEALGANDHESLMIRGAGTVERYQLVQRRGHTVRLTGEDALKQVDSAIREGLLK